VNALSASNSVPASRAELESHVKALRAERSELEQAVGDRVTLLKQAETECWDMNWQIGTLQRKSSDMLGTLTRLRQYRNYAALGLAGGFAMWTMGLPAEGVVTALCGGSLAVGLHGACYRKERVLDDDRRALQDLSPRNDAARQKTVTLQAEILAFRQRLEKADESIKTAEGPLSVLRMATSPSDAGTISIQDQSVLIGNVRVPRQTS
jgi:septal ring factor EnvC (AmiA/AmiB activator)